MGIGLFQTKTNGSGSSDGDPSDMSTSNAAHSQHGMNHQHDLEKIHTIERVGTHAQYYEKGGLRTEGDGVNHDGTEHRLTLKLFLALVAMSFLWVGSQIPLYLFGSVIPDIYADIGGYDRYVWFVIGYLIPNAALCPFVGALSDLFGRKYVAIGGQLTLILGPIVTSTAHSMNVAIAGQVISGVGAGLNELIALAATGEMVPTAKRGQYVGAVVFTILPFAPSVVWAQLIVKASSWRYVGIFVGLWNFIGLVLVFACYHEPKRINSQGYSKKEILRRIDYIGGILSIGGVMCFMMGMQWGAQQYPWGSSHTIAPLVIGILMIIGFFVWEIFLAKYPMVPPRMFSRAKKDMIIILIITFLSGANFFVMLLFWPTEIYNVYGNNRIDIGVRSLPIGFGILLGAVVSLVLIPITKGRIKAIMIFFTALMTAGNGAMSVATPDNISTIVPLTLIACLGVGGVIIPCSIIAQIMCPDDLIATITAITLSIRYVGGAIGFTVYYNIFYGKLFDILTTDVGTKVVVGQLGYLQGLSDNFDTSYIEGVVRAIAEARYKDFDFLVRAAVQYPSVKGKHTYEEFRSTVVRATQVAFAEAYRWPYWISIAFGGTCFILSLFLGDIKPFLDEHIAVVV